MQPAYLEPDGPLVFPDPRSADADGMVAVGGDLSPERLLLAYSSGIFPWYDEDVPPLWWSPDPRAVLPHDQLRVTRRLHRRLRRGGFDLSWNRAFRDVMQRCSRGRSDGTWIVPEMQAAYGSLHDLGHAHSLEVWEDGELVGGIYGVQRGGLFAAESMFHGRTDASKIALVCAVRTLFANGIELFDVQFLTEHLESMGGVERSRDEYLGELARVCDKDVDLSSLTPHW